MSGLGAEIDGCLVDLLVAGDRRAAYHVVRAVFDARGVAHLYEQVVQPALTEIGARWAAGQLTVADEHLATATVQVAIASLYPSFPWPRQRQGRVVIAGVEGNRHELGVRMAADLLALDGWEDVFLGGDVPVDALVAKALELRPVVVALGVSLPGHLAALERTVAGLRRPPTSPRILVGGRACGDLRERLLALDLEVASSAPHAVEVARGWR